MSKEPQRYAHLKALLLDFKKFPLPGIQNSGRIDVLIEQLIESERRIKYVHNLRAKQYSCEITNSNLAGFNPLKVAVYHNQQKNLDEAIWLIFLSTHFGKHGKNKWDSVRHIYGGLGQKLWAWTEVFKDPASFSKWADDNQIKIKELCRFGNHRKYESHKAIGKVVSSYVAWIKSYGNHEILVQQLSLKAASNNENSSKTLFNFLYSDMNIYRFGRTAKFDFLSMLGNTGLINVIADSTYLGNATGPIDGARLLLKNDKKGDIPKRDAERKLIELDDHLNVGMQVLEDALCNWQKSPSKLVRFRG